MLDAQTSWVGQVIDGKYPLLQHLGGSGHSAVFLTEVRRPEPQKAAIKLVPAEAGNGSRLARWSSTAVLSHRHLQRIFQSGRCEIEGANFLYLVMEYGDENLAQVLPQRPLNPEETRDMLVPVLDALAYLHGRNLVHGQLKPENILVVADRLKISADQVSLCGELCPAGSLYDAPEIASTGFSTATDVWALGMTLVEALTQTMPAWQDSAGSDPELPAGMPQPYAEIARNCLRFDAQQRCTVPEIIARMNGTEAARPAQAQVALPAPGTQRARIPWRYVIPAAVLLFLAAFLGSKLFETSRREAPAVVKQQPEQAMAKPSPATTSTGQAARPSASEIAQRHAATAPETTLPASEGVIHRALPEVPPSARDTISGNVRVSVRVQVDAAGNVVGTSLESPGPSKYFARLAEQAAHDWKFTPAQANGQNVPSEWVLRFAFGRSATDVAPTRVAP